VVQGSVGISGENLTNALHGTVIAPIFNGVAQYTNLAIMQEAQGLRLQFEIMESCCTELGNTLGGIRTLSAVFGVYGRVATLVVTEQPSDLYAGLSSNNTIKVELRDSTSSRCIFSTAVIELFLVGSAFPDCPPFSKSLHFPETLGMAGLKRIFQQYSKISISDVRGFLDFLKFQELLDKELSAGQTEDKVRRLFEAIDVGGSLDGDGIPVPDGRINQDEFISASQRCFCVNGYASGTFTVTTANVVVTPSESCTPEPSCLAG
jgi:hypothetical protein